MKKKLTTIILCFLPLLSWAQNITFADATVKAICVANWDTNQDGELSYEEAAAVKNLVGFSNNSRIKTFHELQYFTGLTSIDDSAFDGCSSLTSINIPKGVTSIGRYSFRFCSSLASITIPKSLTSIGEGAFVLCEHLMSITIPESVIDIGEAAFVGCSGLTSITIREGVTYIGDGAFMACSGLTSIIIPEVVTSIGSHAFSDCSNLTSITIPRCVTSIGSYAFSGCSGLTSVTIPNSITSIGNGAFHGCSGLTSVTAEKTTPVAIDSETFTNRANATLFVPAGCKATYEGADYWKEFKEIVEVSTIGTNIEFADNEVKAICVANWDTNNDGELSYDEAAAVKNLVGFSNNEGIKTFQELQYFTGLTSIDSYAFFNCSSLTSITIPNSVNSIGSRAFTLCSALTSITIPKGVTSIGEYAFDCCSGLTSIVVDQGNPVYTSANGANAIIEKASNTLIAGCKNTIIPEGVTSIAGYAFSGCSGLTRIIIPEGVTSIGDNAFYHCYGLTSVTIPKDVTSIGNHAFYNCSGLTSIVVKEGNSVYTSANGANAIIEKASKTLIAGCKNTIIPKGVTSIAGSAFSGCSGMTSITIPEGVTSIGGNAFIDCSGLSSITIPESVFSIGNSVFNFCSRLTSIVVEEGNPVYTSANGANAIIEKASNTLIAGCKSTIIPESVTSIGEYAFDGCSGLTSITLPECVTSIGTYAFFNCYGLTSVTVEMTTPVAIVAGTFTNRANATLHVPAGCKAAYESADIWKEFKEIVEVDASNGTVDNTLTFHYAKESVYWHYPQDLLIQLKSISSDNNRFAADYDFRSGYDFDFEDGRYRSYTDSILIQVSPDIDVAHAEIGLLNSDNEDIISAGLVVVTEVKRHDDAGQWVIKFKLQDGKIDALLDKYLNGKYAVSVDNNIVTVYDVSLELVKTEHAYDFNVNGVSVAGIHNRYTNTEQSPNGMTTWTDDPDNNPNSFCYEMTWHGGEAYSTIFYRDGYSESDLDDWGLNTCNRHGHSLNSPSERKTSGTDNRQNQPILPVAPNCTLPGEDGTWIKIDIEFPDYNEEGKFTPIRGFFVTLDNHFAIEGGNSEKNAWAAYEYRNVAKYSYNNGVKDIYGDEVLITPLWGNKGSIYIKKTNNVIGDVIGFRVHAVNLDGTLTDPDGRAFYVVINDSEQDLNPLDEDDNVDYSSAGSSINEDTNLTGTVVNNMYYNIGTDAGGFSAEDGCIVITKETSDEQMEALEGLGITDEELKQNFTGIIFKVPAGKGKVAVTAETTGNMTLKVKVGNDEPMEMELSGKLKIRVPYNVTEETMVYIFAGTADEGASRGQQRASSGDSSLRIYGIELEATLRGDVNGDTTVDAADVTALADYIVGNGTLANEAAAYVNDDDKIDIADLAALIEIIKNM